MTDRGSDTLASAIVKRYGSQVAQWQLQFALALLAGHTTRHTTVHLVGQPVLASHGLQLEHALDIFVELGDVVGHHVILALYGLVYHVCLGR